MNRKQKAIESRYQKTHKDHMEKLKYGGLYKRLQKVDEYFQAIVEGRVEKGRAWGQDAYYICDQKGGETYICEMYGYQCEWDAMKEAWEKWHNSPLMKALS